MTKKILLLLMVVLFLIGGGFASVTPVQAVENSGDSRCIVDMPNNIFRVTSGTPLFRNATTTSDSVAHLPANSIVTGLTSNLQNGRRFVETTNGVRGWVYNRLLNTLPSC